MNHVAVQPEVTAASFRMNVQQGSAELAGMQESGVFSQLLTMLLGGTPEEGMSQLFDQFVSTEGETTPGEEKKFNEAAMQMAAEMLFQGGQISPELLQNLQNMVQEEIVASGDHVSLNTLLPMQQEATGASASPEVLDPTKVMNTQMKAGEEEGIVSDIPKESIVSATQQTSEDNSASLADQLKYSQSMAEVQKTLKTQKKSVSAEEQPAEIDVEALQQKVNSQRMGGTVQTTSVPKESFPSETKTDVAFQMRDHILQNLKDGNNEFVVKLKPENLGEIEVKMHEKDGHITLSIITANTQTAKLLNEASEALKGSLRPLQAEVKEIISRPEQPQASAQNNFLNSSFDSFQQQQQQFTHHNQQSQTYSPHADFTDSLFEEIMDVQEQMAGTDGLDAYI